MGNVIRTESARRDVRAIAEYIARDNITAAWKWLDQLDATLNGLADFPLIGERVEYLAAGMRRYCLGNYLHFYVQSMMALSFGESCMEQEVSTICFNYQVVSLS